MTFAEAFHEVAVLVVAAAVIGAVAVRLRQPLVVAFIAVGVLAGPSLLDVVRAEDEIHLLAELGIAGAGASEVRCSSRCAKPVTG